MRHLHIVTFKSFSKQCSCSKSSPFCKLGLNFMFLLFTVVKYIFWGWQGHSHSLTVIYHTMYLHTVWNFALCICFHIIQFKCWKVSGLLQFYLKYCYRCSYSVMTLCGKFMTRICLKITFHSVFLLFLYRLYTILILIRMHWYNAKLLEKA